MGIGIGVKLFMFLKKSSEPTPLKNNSWNMICSSDSVIEDCNSNHPGGAPHRTDSLISL